MKLFLKVQLAFSVLYVASCFLLAENVGISYFDLTAVYLLGSAEIIAAKRLYPALRRLFG